MTEQGRTRVIALGERPERTSTRMAVEGVPVMLYRDGERVDAIGTRCTHQGAPLDRGPVRIAGSEATVTCPAHRSVFRLEDGRVARGPARRGTRRSTRCAA
jgi:nitrite reductase/ring-hydroxylating ferredoxin subunit